MHIIVLHNVLIYSHLLYELPFENEMIIHFSNMADNLQFIIYQHLEHAEVNFKYHAGKLLY